MENKICGGLYANDLSHGRYLWLVTAQLSWLIPAGPLTRIPEPLEESTST